MKGRRYRLFGFSQAGSFFGDTGFKIFSASRFANATNETVYPVQWKNCPESEITIDPDYQAVLDYATAQGYTLPSAGQQTLQDQLVVDLKAAGVWSKLDSFSVFATDGDSNFSLIDWKRLLTMTAVNSPTFTTNQGFKGDGVSAYISSEFTQSIDGVNWSSPNGSFGYFVRIASSSTAQCYGGTDRDNTMRRGSIKSINGNSLFSALASDDIFAHININSTESELFYNGVSQGSNGSPSFLDEFDEFDYLREGVDNRNSDGQLSIGFMGGDLSAEAADFNTSIQNYISAL